MKDKRVLYVSSEVVPYLPENDISSTAFEDSKTDKRRWWSNTYFLCQGLVT